MNLKKGFRLLKLYVLLAVAFILLGACVSAKQKLIDAGMKPLSSQELQTLFSEKRSASFSGQKGSGTVEYFPDGTQQANWSGGSGGGTYSIEDDKYCSKMDFRKGVVKCSTWFKVGENTYDLILSDGTKDSTVRFQ